MVAAKQYIEGGGVPPSRQSRQLLVVQVKNLVDGLSVASLTLRKG